MRVSNTLPGLKYTFKSQLYVVFCILDIFKGTYNPPGSKYNPKSQVYPQVSGTPLSLRYTLHFIFWLYLKVSSILSVLGTTSDIKYISRSQVHVALYVLGIYEDICNLLDPKVHIVLHILGQLKGLCNLPDPKYILRFMLWIDLKVLAILFLSISLGLRYMSRFIFWVD